MSAFAGELSGGGGEGLRVAIVGSGPSGFYAADYLLKSEEPIATVHMFERLPAPFGLVRYGVAPDHAKIRNVIKQYEKTATHERFRFWGNVTVGRDITIEELRERFDAVILAYGAGTDRTMDIPGIDLPRSYTATEFCAWYNGHPDYRDRVFDLNHESVAVIGQGNVAMDVARVLGKSVDELAKTDMAAHAVEALRGSRVRDIHVIGRRGPAQAAFTPKEIKELGELEGCDLDVHGEDLEVNEESREELLMSGHESNKRNMDILWELAAKPSRPGCKRIVLHFLKSPVEVRGGDDGGVGELVLERNELMGEPGEQKARSTGEVEYLECGVLFRSIGYKGMALSGAPFDDRGGVVPNVNGRVEPGVYVVGWIKRGPSGLIGTNKKDSEESVRCLLEDVAHMERVERRDDAELAALLGDRGVRAVSYDDWLRIDAAELERGVAAGKPRDNFVTVEEMLAVLG